MPRSSDTVDVGKPAPEFALRSIDGQEYKLAALRSRPLLLSFIRGTW
jgi:peroxiredoxin